MITCAKCQTENADNASACARCGGRLITAEDSLDHGQTFERADRSILSEPDESEDQSGPDTLDAARTMHNIRRSESKTDLIGGVIAGRYEIIERIGRGGMGVVYRARDKTLGREVAIKRLLAPEKGAQRGIERFLQEARAIAALNHRNIVTVYELAEDDDGPFIVMEYLNGGNLADRIRQSGHIELDESLNIIKSISQGLSYAHRRSIIHRDIKPGNIIFAEDGTPKLVDFGLAQMASAAELSLTGIGMGTPSYMPPEQKRDAKRADHRSDIYSLAKTLYHMITGDIPDAVDLDMVPAMIRPAIKRALKPKPEDRQFSVDELVKELESAEPAEESTPSSAGGACPDCGASNPMDLKYCRNCGAGLCAPCPKCGHEDRDGITHCGSCGVNIPKYKEADEALQKAKEHLSNHDFAAARKEAERGLRAGYKEDELKAIRDRASESGQSLAKLRESIDQKVSEGKYEEAAEDITKALQLNPSQEDLVKLQGKLSDAIRRRGIKRAGTDLSDALKNRDYTQAIEICDRILNDYGDNAKAKQIRQQALELLVKRKKEEAASYAERGEYKTALALLDEAYKIKPEDAEVCVLAERLRNDMKLHHRTLYIRKARRSALVVVLIISLLIIVYAIITAQTNQKRLKDARLFAASGQLEKAKESLESVGWFWAWGLRDVNAQLARTVYEKSVAEAREAQASGDWQKAIAASEHAIASGHYDTSLAAALLANSHEALLKKQVYETFLAEAREAQASGDWQKVMAACERAIASGHDDTSLAAFILANSLKQQVYGSALAEARAAYNRGDWQAAISASERAIASGHKDTSLAALLLNNSREAPLRHQSYETYLAETLEAQAREDWQAVAAASQRAIDSGHTDVTAARALLLEARHQLGPEVFTTWPFNSTEARSRQQETAEALDMPVEKTIDLGGGVRLEMVLIPAGEFIMGSPDGEEGIYNSEGPQRRVRITQPFYMGKYPVTQAQYERLTGDNPSRVDGANNPVERVSWNNAQQFITRLNGLNQGAFRLSTEAEWEYACRAGTSTRFYSGDRDSDLDGVGWYNSNSGGRTQPVGQKAPNAWGLYDMHGNVYEWCEDRWQDNYRGLETTDPTGPGTGTSRVLRGGSWSLNPRYCRSALRGWNSPDTRGSSYGFRVVSPAR